MTPSYFAISYDDPGVITRLKNEQEIQDQEWTRLVDDGEADVFRVALVNATPQVRRMLVETTDDDRLVIADWELIV